jgi:hypothetical protein
VRGVGLLVAVKHFPPGPSEPPAPPSFETLTWCVDLRIEVEAPGASTSGSRSRPPPSARP